MSEIPFVKLLGDELEDAARRAPAPRRRRRRFAICFAAGALALSGTAAATGLFSLQAETQATTGVSCHTSADVRLGPMIGAAPDTTEIGRLSAVELCRRELAAVGTPVSELVACSAPANVAVIPGRVAADCVAAGLAPLSAEYARAEARTVRLERDLLRIEASADCIAPAEFARRVQAVLDRSGWDGWKAIVTGSAHHRPCGTLSSLGGAGQRTFSGAYDAEHRQVAVRRTASRRLTDLLFSRKGIFGPLIRDSGARCFTVDALRAHVEATFAAHDVEATLRVTPHVFRGGESLSDEDGRATRYAQGCAIVTSASPGADDHAVQVEAWIKP